MRRIADARFLPLFAGLSLGFFSGVSARADGNGFRVERPILPAAAGPNRLPVDVTLLLRAAPGAALADLRLFDGSNREVPYLLVSPVPPPLVLPVGTLLAIPTTRASSGFEVDFGKIIVADQLQLLGLPGPLLKRVGLEASGDRRHWNVLVTDATVFNLPDEHLERMRLDFTPGAFRYFRVTWDDRMSTPPPWPSQVRARTVEPVRAGRPAPLAPIVFVRRAGEPKTSRFQIRLPWSRLPIVALSLGVVAPGGHLLRAAKILEPHLSGDEVVPVVVGESTLRSVRRGELLATDLRIPIQTPAGAELELVVDDGDNPPLDLKEVVAEFAPQPFIYFEAASTTPLMARYGDPKRAAPQYDLEVVRDTVDHMRTSLSTWGNPVPLDAELKAPEPITETTTLAGAVLDRAGFLFARTISPGHPGLAAVPLDVAVLAHAASDFRDLRIIDDQNRQVPFLVEKRDEPLALPLAPIIKSAKPGLSIYDLQFPQKDMPPSRLVLSTPLRVFQRTVSLSIAAAEAERRQPRAPLRREIDRRAWAHADPETAAPSLLLDLPSLPEVTAELAVDEGDNSPLSLGPAELLLPSWRLRYFRDGQSPLLLLYGRADIAAPRYDLALLAPRLLAAIASDATLGAEVLAAPAPKPAAGQEKLFWGMLVVMVVALLALIGKLVQKG